MTAPQTAVAAGAATSASGLANGARVVQQRIQARLLQDVIRVWPLLDAKRLDETWPGWSRVMTMLLTDYHGQSAAAAAAYYRAARSQALGEAPASVVKLAPTPADEWLTKALGFSGPGKLSNPVGSPDQASKVALSTTLGTCQRVAADGQRTTILDTVEADPAGARWYRVTDGNPCAFCALLASRGAVYRSKETGSFETHNACGCTAAVSFDGQIELTGAAQRAHDVYYSMDRQRGKTALQNFRAAWAAESTPAPSADTAA